MEFKKIEIRISTRRRFCERIAIAIPRFGLTYHYHRSLLQSRLDKGGDVRYLQDRVRDALPMVNMCRATIDMMIDVTLLRCYALLMAV